MPLHLSPSEVKSVVNSQTALKNCIQSVDQSTMSSMEVDVPQLNGFAYNPSKVAKKSVHFGSPPAPANATTAAAEITIVTKKTESSAKPKHKARRRARHPSKSEDVENGGGVPKPISPNKVHKMAERNRHSRSGMRGLPKKGV